MQHSFDVSVAEQCGVDEAIFIKNLAYWIKFNHDLNINFHDGRYWTYNTQEAFSKWFSYWTPKQIIRIIKSCVKQGLVIEGSYNLHKYDQKKWYTLTDEGLKLLNLTNLPNGQMEITKRSNVTDQTVRPIANTIPNEIHNKRLCASTNALSRFDDFWNIYPVKKSKVDAKKIWARQKLDAKADEIIAAINKFKTLDNQWVSGYIPNPDRFLNKELWTNEISPIIPKKSSTSHANNKNIIFPPKDSLIQSLVNAVHSHKFSHPIVYLLLEKIGSASIRGDREYDLNIKINNHYKEVCEEYIDNPSNVEKRIAYFKEHNQFMPRESFIGSNSLDQALRSNFVGSERRV